MEIYERGSCSGFRRGEGSSGPTDKLENSLTYHFLIVAADPLLEYIADTA